MPSRPATGCIQSFGVVPRAFGACRNCDAAGKGAKAEKLRVGVVVASQRVALVAAIYARIKGTIFESKRCLLCPLPCLRHLGHRVMPSFGGLPAANLADCTAG